MVCFRLIGAGVVGHEAGEQERAPPFRSLPACLFVLIFISQKSIGPHLIKASFRAKQGQKNEEVAQ